MRNLTTTFVDTWGPKIWTQGSSSLEITHTAVDCENDRVYVLGEEAMGEGQTMVWVFEAEKPGQMANKEKVRVSSCNHY